MKYTTIFLTMVYFLFLVTAFFVGDTHFFIGCLTLGLAIGFFKTLYYLTDLDLKRGK